MLKEVELVIPGEFKDEPIFYHIVKNFSVVPNIVEASFSTEIGWAIVKFEGEEKELARLFKFLKEKGVEVKFR
ncbi:MAG: FeS-binding protein [Candidatus Omnitrophota bacterium]|nr:MAG: FeS-binding protein [Candidatus Omnitrophota bacterium]